MSATAFGGDFLEFDEDKFCRMLTGINEFECGPTGQNTNFLGPNSRFGCPFFLLLQFDICHGEQNMVRA
jgi:hypothetical protein